MSELSLTAEELAIRRFLVESGQPVSFVFEPYGQLVAAIVQTPDPLPQVMFHVVSYGIDRVDIHFQTDFKQGYGFGQTPARLADFYQEPHHGVIPIGLRAPQYSEFLLRDYRETGAIVFLDWGTYHDFTIVSTLDVKIVANAEYRSVEVVIGLNPEALQQVLGAEGNRPDRISPAY